MIILKSLKSLWLLTIVFSLCLFIVLCSSKVNAENKRVKIVLQLAWKHQFQFAGYYAALAKGYYQEVGLDVTIVEGGDDRFAREELLNKRAQYGVAGAELLLHRLDGDPFVVLAPIFQHSPSILLTKNDSNISSLQDLIGKRVMLLPGKKDADILAAFLNEGVPLKSIQRINQSYNLDDLIIGRTDAVSAYLSNEPWHLEQKGVVPKIISPLTYGVDFYSDCLFTTEQEIQDNPERVENFLKASLRGWEYAMSHSEEIIDLLLTDYGLEKKRTHLQYEAESIRKIMLPDLVQIGHMNPGRWLHIAKMYVKLEMINSDFSFEGFLYDPNPELDYTWVKWIVGIVLSISLLVSISTFILLIFNRKLKAEIEERKRTETSLKESEKKYKHIFNNAPAGIYEIDFIKTKFINVNEVMCTFSGYSEKEFLSMNPLDLLTEESKTRFILRLKKKIAGEKISNSVEFNIINKNGQELCVVLNSDFIYDKEKLTGARVVVHDISERKLAEEEKITAQKIVGEQKKLALVGQIAGKMAHDFNNILGIIMGNVELLLMDSNDTVVKKKLELIFKQTLRGKNLTKNLVAFAKDQEPKQLFFSINEKIELVLALLKTELKDIRVIMNTDHRIPDLLADPGMIEHTFVNLVQNSIHATSMVEQPKIAIKIFHKDQNFYIEIEDNGCGIPEEIFDRIYEPAFTMKGIRDVTGSYKPGIKGTGYGMANVKKYIEQHKGNIIIDSKVGKGTKITISLPVRKNELTEREIMETRKVNFSFGKYILIVEDEQSISDVQYKILTHEPCNHKVDVAQSGQIAMDLISKNRYDFVSLDYLLQGEINGMDVYNHIRKTNKTIPILFISGNIEFLESIKDLKQKDSNIDHLSKPCQNKDYVSAINELLAKTLSAKE